MYSRWGGSVLTSYVSSINFSQPPFYWLEHRGAAVEGGGRKAEAAREQLLSVRRMTKSSEGAAVVRRVEQQSVFSTLVEDGWSGKHTS